MHIIALLVHKSNIKNINTYLKITVNYQKSYIFASSITNNEYMKKLLFLIMLLPMMAKAQTLEECQKAAEDVRNGEMKAIGFLVGQVMKKSKGKANPGAVNKLIQKKLS